MEILRQQIPDPDFVLSSKNLEYDKLHVLESMEMPGIRVIHSNAHHNQDAFAVKSGALCVCDGVSSKRRSKPAAEAVSRILAQKIDEAENSAQVFEGDEVQAALAEFANDQEYTSFDPGQSNPDLRASDVEGGKTTFLALKFQKEKREIEWTGVGDSPLLVLDKTGNGWSFEIKNTQFAGLTDKTFASEEFHFRMKDPRTSAIGINRKGGVDTEAITYSMESGSISYKKGRVVIAATDFLTKMMDDSPEVAAARMTVIDKTKNSWHWDEINQSREKMLQAENPFYGPKFRPELFFNGELSNDQIAEFLVSSDDVTAVCIKMDELFKE